MLVTPLQATPNKFDTLLTLAHPLWNITYRQLTYVHTPSPLVHTAYVVSERVCTQGISNGGQAPPTAVPDVADPFSQNVPNSDHSRMPAMGDLRRLAYRYLHNPDSRVDTLRIWLNPSGHRFMVMILLEVDDIV
jgi:hypothetical protein